MDQEKTSVEKGSALGFPTPPLATPEEEKRLVRKIDLRILPITCILYLFACEYGFTARALSGLSLPLSKLLIVRVDVDLDRSNLGNARLQGLPQEILNGDPTGVLFDWVNSAFYFSYVGSFFFLQYSARVDMNTDLRCAPPFLPKPPRQILCQVPATVCSKLFPPSYWMAAAAIGWGICSTLSVSIGSYHSISFRSTQNLYLNLVFIGVGIRFWGAHLQSARPWGL